MGGAGDAPFQQREDLQPPGAGGPTTIITDQASYSDQVFGLFWLLGYQFSPRATALPDQRFWRRDRDADYGPLNGLARNRIDRPVGHARAWEGPGVLNVGPRGHASH